jgi:hypothetical protein
LISYVHLVRRPTGDVELGGVLFDDANDIADFVQVLKLEAAKLRQGLSRMAVSLCVKVLLREDGEIHGEFIADLYPAFSQWRCPACLGCFDHCTRCDGKGWDVASSPNADGVYVREVRIAPKTFAFMLMREEYWKRE